MQLLLKKVYKNPLVNGEYSYSVDALPSGEQKAKGDRLLEAGEINDQKAENGVTLWPQAENYIEEKIDQQLTGKEEEKFAQVMGEDLVSSPSESAASAYKTENTNHYSSNYLDEAQVNRLRKEAYNDGLTKAEDEYRDIKNKAEMKLKEAENCLQEARKRSKEIIASSEEKIIELAMAVAAKLVQTQLEIAPETIVAIVQDAINMLNGGEQVEIYVHPQDLGTCLELKEKIKAEYPEFMKMEFLADSSLPRGSCRIETESGLVEYLIDEEQEKLKEILLRLVKLDDTKKEEEREPVYGKH